jgi:radical SAM superfamily enzyme YgiQ (UPF0313 family)
MDYPKWLAYATGLLEKRFSSVRLVDAPASKWDEATVQADADQFDPDLIVVESNFSSLSNDLRIVGLLKGSVEAATTVLVGPPASQFPDEILADGAVDIVARMEFDFTIKEIAQAFEADKGLEDIRGISYKLDGRVVHNPDREFTTSDDLDEMPFVSKVYKKHLDMRNYFLSQSLFPVVQIFTGRGCPHRCTFCSWPETLMGRKYRMRSVGNLVAELEYIRDELPEVKEIFFEDDTFTIDERRVRVVCDEIIRRKLKVVWSCNARADLSYETLRAMRDAGCRLIIVGYESGNDGILKNIGKAVDTARMRAFTKDARKVGLMIHGDFIIGLPGETHKTARQTIDFIKELKPDMLQVAVATPIPGTHFYDWAREQGFLLTEDMEDSIDAQGFQRCIVSYPDFTCKDIEAYVDRALRGYYLSPAYIRVTIRNILGQNGWRELQVMARASGVFLKYLGRAR